VTELSGRGIGLDVVRDAATRLGGEVTVTTEATEGTTVTLEVPLSLVSFEALAVEAAGITAFVPLDAVSQTLRVRSADIHLSERGESLTYNGAVIPFLSLATILAEPVSAAQPGVAWSVVVVEGRGSAAAIGVHRLFGTSSIVVRPLPPFLVISAVISGVWLDADGNPKLVLDPDELVAEARRERRPDPVSAGGPDSPVLVIDDSLTTRMLEQSILESAGYSVDVASSGEEALAMAQSKRYLLFLVDVEMPGMDGFTFIEHTRVHPQLREIPAVLVTSRSSHEDRQRGLDAGASAYITKGEFDQGGLLDRIRALTAT
jgi:two-component system chemotaxis sensor kinase CheA